MAFLIYIGATSFRGVRYDMTEENLYTLSPGTISIMKKLDSPLRLKLYYSKTAANKGTEGLRTFNNYFLYVVDLLEQYREHSRNNITIDVIDPRPDTVEEEDALAYGLKKFNLTETESYFFGLVAENETGAEKIIEFFDPSQKEKLEYDLTKLIYTTLNPQKKSLGIVSSLDVLVDETNSYMAQIMRMQGKPVEDSWFFTKMVSDFYNLKKIEKDTDKISGIDTLMVIHPRDLPEKTLYAIDQFVMKGGNLLVLVDPNAVVDRAGATAGVSASPDKEFSKLMKKWGIRLRQGVYAGDKYLAGIGRFNQAASAGRLLALLNCNINCSAKFNDPITSGINNTAMVFPGALESTEVDGIEQTPILSTTEKGNTYTANSFELNNPKAIWNRFKEGDEAIILGMKSVGKFKSAYPDGIKESDIEPVKESSKKSAVVVFSDVDFIANQFAFKNTFLGAAVANDNSTLVLNSLEALTGDLDLMSVRSKGRIDRSFDVINKIEFEAEKKTADKVKEINANITRFQAELNELGSQANSENIALLQNQGIKKKKELAKKIASLKRELRTVKREGREKVEQLGTFFQYLNTMLVPFLIIVFGLFYNRKRSLQMETKTNKNRSNELGKKNQRGYKEVNV